VQEQVEERRRESQMANEEGKWIRKRRRKCEGE
jgi:hypothetical protein